MSEALSTVEYLDTIQKSAPADILKISLSMAFAEERKYVTVDVPVDQYPELEIYQLTDVQWGHVCCNKKRFVDYRDWILAEPNRFTVFTGDMVNAASLLSVGTPWEDEAPPMEQVYDFVRVCMPMRNRILGYVGGNHERHTRATLGKSVGSWIATQLRIPFSQGQQFVRLNYGAWKPYKINLWHGRGSAQTKGAKAQVLHRFMQQGDAHLYMMGHLHDVLVLPAWRIKDNVKGKVLGLEKFYGCMSSSFLEFWGAYGEEMGLTPTDTIMARAIVTAKGHQEVTLR